MLYLLTIAIVAATLTHGVAVASLRARAEITPQAAANYLVQTTYTDAACLHLSTGSTTQADLCLRTNAGKFQKITSFANNATTTSYAESTCMTVTSIVTESLLVSCTLRQSGYYGMSSFSTAPTFPSQEQGITISGFPSADSACTTSTLSAIYYRTDVCLPGKNLIAKVVGPMITLSYYATSQCLGDPTDTYERTTNACLVRSSTANEKFSIVTASLTYSPTASPTSAPTISMAPTVSPTSTPTATPTASPTSTPTAAPTATPTSTPTISMAPTGIPTSTPTGSPTSTPTGTPTFTVTTTETSKPTPGLTFAILIVSKGKKACFAASETVSLESGDLKAISDVIVGDRVLAANAAGNTVYSEVIFVPHGANTEIALFTQISTVDGRDIKMTQNHILPAGACKSSTTMPLIYASQVSVGDCIQTVSGEQKVSKVATVRGEGVYTIVTKEEFIVVNGIIASPFGINHMIANLYYNIHRIVYASAPLLMSSPIVHSFNEALGMVTLFLGQSS